MANIVALALDRARRRFALFACPINPTSIARLIAGCHRQCRAQSRLAPLLELVRFYHLANNATNLRHLPSKQPAHLVAIAPNRAPLVLDESALPPFVNRAIAATPAL